MLKQCKKCGNYSTDSTSFTGIYCLCNASTGWTETTGHTTPYRKPMKPLEKKVNNPVTKTDYNLNDGTLSLSKTPLEKVDRVQFYNRKQYSETEETAIKQFEEALTPEQAVNVLADKIDEIIERMETGTEVDTTVLIDHLDKMNK